MNKKIILLAIISVFLISCTKNDNEQIAPFDGEVKASDIVGTWTVTEFYTDNGSVDTKVAGVNVTANFKSKGKDFKNAKVIFSQNPDVVVSSGTFTNVTTVSYLAFSETEEKTESVLIAGNWSLKNNIVSIGANTTFLDYTIVEFSGNTLKLKYEYDENVEVISGYDGHAKATIHITVTK